MRRLMCFSMRLKLIFDFPSVIEDVPGGPTDEVAWLPQCPAPRASLWHLVRCSKGEGLDIGLLDRLEHNRQVRHCLVSLAPVNHAQIAIMALQDMLGYLPGRPPASVWPLAQLLTVG